MHDMYEIDLVQDQRHWQTMIVADAYTYREDKKMPWLQKICFRILGKLEAEYIHYVEQESTRIQIRPRGVLEKAVPYLNGILDLFENKCDCILMERGMFHELLREPVAFHIHNAIGITPAYIPGDPHPFKTAQYMGITIICVPWMKGVLPIPKQIIFP